MNLTKISKILMTFFAVVLCFGPVGLAEPLGTAFTYQGRLIDANKTADGLYDFQFKLFDANSGGNKLGADVNKTEVGVIDGYFTAELDFGNVFDGNDRWLEIDVRQVNDPNYTTLSQRQKVTPTPYALYAKTAGSSVSPTIPQGVIVMWSGSIGSIPSGWALCNGSGGTPDLRDRFIVGAGGGYGVGATGGEATHTLTIAEMPAHSHLAGYEYSWQGHAEPGSYDNLLGPANTHSTSATGGGGAHENRPPYYALAYIMKL